MAIANRPLPDEKIGGDDAELLRVARERRQKAYDFDEDNRKRGIEDLEFLAGDQWPSEIIQERKEDSRPALTINRMPQFVRQVTGDIRQNRPSIKVRPADDVADDDIAEIFSGTIRHIEYASDALTAYQTAAEGAAQCGMGNFRIVTEYSDDDTFEQNIRIKRIRDHFSVLWDPHAVEATKSDARYCFVEEELDIETFKARYPDASTEGWDSAQQSDSHIGDWLTHQTVRVAEYWTVEKEQRTLSLLADGRVVDTTDPGKSGVYEGLQVVRTRKVWRNKVEMRLINGVEVLEKPFAWPGRWIPVIPVLGEEIHIEGKTIRHGVIRNAKDAQRAYNYWRSAQTEIIALQPKVPWLVTPTNIKGLETAWQEANRRNLPYLPYTPDPSNAGMAPSRQAPQMGSGAMTQEVMIAADEMKATTGIYDAALGAQGNETSGVAIRARQMESDISTIAYVDNLARAITHAGRILVDLIPKIYDTERVVRILNEDDTTEAVTINQVVVDQDGNEHRVNDISVGKYDVVITTGPSYSTKRSEAAANMIEWARSDPEGAVLIRDLIVQNLDWPGADEMAERFRKALPPGMAEPREGEEPAPSPPTPEQMAAQAELELKAQEAARKDAEAAAKIAKTQAETDALQVETMRQAMEAMLAGGALQEMMRQQVAQIMAEMGDGQV